MTLRFTVNGVAHQVDSARGDERLIDFLHDDLDLTGTKFCCGIGVCRACTVSTLRPPNDAAVPVVSCSTPLAMVDGLQITTIEGVAPPGDLLPIQQAFLRTFSFQCGYCTPGFVMAAQIFLDSLARARALPADLDKAIEAAIGPHICRCSGYARYYAALRDTAEALFAKKG